MKTRVTTRVFFGREPNWLALGNRFYLPAVGRNFHLMHTACAMS
jgi:hypothetical protein